MINDKILVVNNVIIIN